MSTVLVVDDSVVDRQVAAGYIEEAGFNPLTVSSAGDALQSLERCPCDLVLTDLQMPEMNGLELVQAVKARFPAVPVVLMTARGSEEIAVTALKTGAASYIPKRDLKDKLRQTLNVVLSVARARRERQQVFEFMTFTESRFTLGHEPEGRQALISYFQDGLRIMNLCDEGDQVRVGTALSEALTNAVHHGNLELNSALRENADGSYSELARERAQQPPYRDRRVHVTARLSESEATYVIRDEGPGFDPSMLPDPTDPENLMKVSGRGLLLIRTFMDEVRFNELGNEITMSVHRTA